MSNSRPDEKRCTKCEKEKPFTDFSPRKDGVGGRHSQCRECRCVNWNRHAKAIGKKRREAYADRNDAKRQIWRDSTKRYRDKNSVELKAKQRDIRRANKKHILLAYGGKCDCCGEEAMEFLAIDHEAGNGAEDRRVFGGSIGVYRRLLKNLPELLPGFRVLCHNCNCSIGWHGYCPHRSTSSV